MRRAPWNLQASGDQVLSRKELNHAALLARRPK
jgi:hypothetical protein